MKKHAKLKIDFLEMKDVMYYLRYKDPRSVVRWCKIHKVPLIKLGAKRGILSRYLTKHIDYQLVTFVE